MKEAKSKEKDKKTRTISLRCTEKEYSDVENQAKGGNMSITEYILSEKSPIYSHRAKDKRRLHALVDLQQTVNRLTDYCAELPEQDDFLINILIHLQTEAKILWE